MGTNRHRHRKEFTPEVCIIGKIKESNTMGSPNFTPFTIENILKSNNRNLECNRYKVLENNETKQRIFLGVDYTKMQHRQPFYKTSRLYKISENNMGNKSYQTENYFHKKYIDRYNNPEAYKNFYPDDFMLNYKKESVSDTWKLATNTRNRSINTHHTLSSSKLFQLNSLCMITHTVIF